MASLTTRQTRRQKSSSRSTSSDGRSIPFSPQRPLIVPPARPGTMVPAEAVAPALDTCRLCADELRALGLPYRIVLRCTHDTGDTGEGGDAGPREGHA